MSLLDAQSPVRSSPRLSGLDRLRGLAIGCMVVDHVCLVVGGGELLRWSVGRLALPVFLLVAGSLHRRLVLRHAGIAVVGALLPVAVPWIDSPNVLVLYVAAVSVLDLVRRLGASPWVLVVVALVAAANGVATAFPHSFDVLAVVALVSAGSLVVRDRLARLGDRLPRCLAAVGRYPVTVYVGHLFLLQLVAAW